VIGEFGFYAIGSVSSFGGLKKGSNPNHCAIALQREGALFGSPQHSSGWVGLAWWSLPGEPKVQGPPVPGDVGEQRGIGQHSGLFCQKTLLFARRLNATFPKHQSEHITVQYLILLRRP